MGIYLSTPKTDKLSEDGENDRLRYGVSSMQGWRSTMEDAHAAYLDLDASTAFFGVYDGHGGKGVAKFCAKYLHEQVLKNEAYLAGDLGVSLQKSFLRMDEMMCAQRGQREVAVLEGKSEQIGGAIGGLIRSPRGEANGHLADWALEETESDLHDDYRGPTSGSTACVAIIRNNQLVVANAGDSRCVISRKGQAYNLSRDHKPDLEAEKERIIKAGGFVQCGRVNGSLNLARAIGDMELKRNRLLPAEKQIVTANPDINKVELCDDDEFLILACDGIWDCMSSQQLVDYVREQLNNETKLSAVCEKVFDRCLAPTSGGEGCDNMTMILVQFKKPIECSSSGKEQPLQAFPDPPHFDTEEDPEMEIVD
ncbi:Phosphoprotein phosphatase [Bertholletia excelsa]